MSDDAIDTLYLVDLEAELSADGNMRVTVYYADDEAHRAEVQAGRSVAKVRTFSMSPELAQQWEAMIVAQFLATTGQ